MVELEGIEPSAGISVRRDRHAVVSPTKDQGPAFFHKSLDSLAFFIPCNIIKKLYQVKKKDIDT